jgi:hypothetical protein
MSDHTLRANDSEVSDEQSASKPNLLSHSISFFLKKNANRSFTSEKSLQQLQQHIATDRTIGDLKQNPNFSIDAKQRIEA